MLFNEPKLLKKAPRRVAEALSVVSVLFNEPKLLKTYSIPHARRVVKVSVLFNEPKLLKFGVLSAKARRR